MMAGFSTDEQFIDNVLVTIIRCFFFLLFAIFLH